jgi:hypothetical protein
MHHIVLALAPGEVDAGDAALAGEAPQPRHEVPAHRRDHRRRGDRLPQIAADEPHDPLRPLQLRHIQVAVETVDRFQFEDHVIRQHIGHAAG